MSYVAEHASALADVTEAGAPVAFVRHTPGTYDAATGLTSPSSRTEVAGAAMRVKGDPRKYATLGLTEHEAPTLFFVATTYGDVPPLGASVSFGGATYTVRDVAPFAPDGTAIFSRVVVAV